MDRKELIRKLDNIAALEDDGVAFIANYVMASVRKGDYPEAKKRRLLEILEGVKRDSAGHAMALKEAVEGMRRRV